LTRCSVRPEVHATTPNPSILTSDGHVEIMILHRRCRLPGTDQSRPRQIRVTISSRHNMPSITFVNRISRTLVLFIGRSIEISHVKAMQRVWGREEGKRLKAINAQTGVERTELNWTSRTVANRKHQELLGPIVCNSLGFHGALSMSDIKVL
jgi:hypothetical protein